jgi:hypothetical protein
MAVLRWVVVNSAIFACLLYITIEEAPAGIERLVKLPFFLEGIAGFVAFCVNNVRRDLHKKGRPVRAGVSGTIKAIQVCWLVYLGFWITAVMAIWGWMCTVAIYDGEPPADA